MLIKAETLSLFWAISTENTRHHAIKHDAPLILLQLPWFIPPAVITVKIRTMDDKIARKV